MTEDIKKLLSEALDNKEFNDEIYAADHVNYIKPKLWSDELTKHIYAAAYYGWLVGKGQFDKSKYYG